LPAVKNTTATITSIGSQAFFIKGKNVSDKLLDIKIEIKGDDLAKALDRLKDGLKSKTMMEAIGMTVRDWSKRRIRSRENTAPDGSKWEPLVASTLLKKKKKARRTWES